MAAFWSPVHITADHVRLLMRPAERADVIVDFTNVPAGNYVLANVGPDEPFGGGAPGVDFPVADVDTTGQVMEFHVMRGRKWDPSTQPRYLKLPALRPLPAPVTTRPLALMEMMSMHHDGKRKRVGTVVLTAITQHKMLGERSPKTQWLAILEVWEFYNCTAAPIQDVHEVTFEVVKAGMVLTQKAKLLRRFNSPVSREPPSWETLQGYGHRLSGEEPPPGKIRKSRSVRLALFISSN